MLSNEQESPWPERFSERFHIFALGEKFDVDAFLATSKLRPDFVWKRKGNGPTNGLELLLGDSHALPLPQQEKIAIAYLETHREELRALTKSPGLESLNLGLVYRLPLDATGICVGPSGKLMWHALDAGVIPLYYGTLERRQIELNRPVRRLPDDGKAHRFGGWEGTPLWKAIEKAVDQLVEDEAIFEGTFREIVIGSICEEIGRCKKAVADQLR